MLKITISYTKYAMIKTATSNTKNNFNNRLIDVDFMQKIILTKLCFTLQNNV
jgi:hypothetical protein